MTSVAVLVPYRPDGSWRDRTWKFIRDQIDVPVIVADDPRTRHPFSMGRAFNAARRQTDAAVLALWNADVDWHPAAVAEAVATIEGGVGCVIPFSRMLRLTRHATVSRLGGDPEDLGGQRVECNGLTVISADAWQDWDERYEGWGPDDLSWRNKIEQVTPTVMLEHTCVHLWHPDRENDQSAVEQDAKARSFALYEDQWQ